MRTTDKSLPLWHIALRRSIVSILVTSACLATGLRVRAGTYTNSFTDPNQLGGTLNASGTLSDGSTWTPVVSNGVIMLTTNQVNLIGTLDLDDLDSGQPIESFTARFKLQFGPGSGNPADGFYFGFSPDINSSTTFDEEGPSLAGGGMGVEFDTYDNGIALEDTIGIDLMTGLSGGPFHGNGGNEIAVHPLTKASMVTSTPQDVLIQLNRNGTLNVTYGGTVIYTNQYLYGWAPINGQFALGARTGGEDEVTLLSNLSITTTVASSTQTPPTITSQPQSQTVNEGQPANLAVGFDGTAPFGFQWTKNGTAIPVSTNAPLTSADVTAAQNTKGVTYQAYSPLSILTIAKATPADNGQYAVAISNTNSAGTAHSVTSQPATLTVKADTNAPTVVSVTASNDFSHVLVVFSRPVTQASAETTANYSINGLTVTSASLSTNDNRTVALTTSAQSYNTPYTLTINNIKDLSFTGNTIAANTTATFTSPFLAVTGAGALAETNNTTYDVGITFSLPLDPASATNSANYKLSAGTVSMIAYLTNSPGVLMQVKGLNVGSNYTVSVSNVANLVGNKITATNVSFTVSGMQWGEVGADQLGLGFPNGYAVIAVATNAFDVYSDGISEWNNYDESTFVYQTITGDFDKKVRVEYQDLSSEWARAGLVARDVPNFGVDAITQTGDPSGTQVNTGTPPFTGQAGRYQKIHVNPVGPTLTGPGTAGNASWEGNRRLDMGGPSSTALTGPNSVPQYPNAWCRLQRAGQTFTIYRSDDGMNWVNLGSTTWPDTNNPASTPMPATLYVGPEYSPENGNITDEASRGQFVAKFRDYGDTSSTTGGGGSTIAISRSGNNVTLTFSGTLQSAGSITGPWTDVPGPSPQTVTPTGTALFYRSRQ